MVVGRAATTTRRWWKPWYPQVGVRGGGRFRRGTRRFAGRRLLLAGSAEWGPDALPARGHLARAAAVVAACHVASGPQLRRRPSRDRTPLRGGHGCRCPRAGAYCASDARPAAE